MCIIIIKQRRIESLYNRRSTIRNRFIIQRLKEAFINIFQISELSWLCRGVLLQNRFPGPSRAIDAFIARAALRS